MVIDMTLETDYEILKKHYEDCLARHGDTHLGVDWPKPDEARLRHEIMWGLLASHKPATLLDVGCGLSHFYEFLLETPGASQIQYSGLDISPEFVNLSKKKYPENEYFCVDLIQDPNSMGTYDYLTLNGLFTQRRGMTPEAMRRFFERMLLAAFSKARVGLAFNVMSKQVDWEKEGSFHLSFDEVASFVTKNLSRKFVFRHDYGLYEFTTYVYRA